ncbi:MAG: cytidine deaminase [Alistipes sp.]|nr:cytidine deaminase [Alistipes sp.]
MDKKFVFEYEHYDSAADMPEADRLLAAEAQKAAATANAPYSNFSVGAAARLHSGTILYGSNFESDVYPAGLCAERSLLFHALSCHAGDRIEALAIASQPSLTECYPCGQCRQVLLDAERKQNSPIRIIMTGGGTATIVESARLLLPFTFSLKESKGV